MDFIVCIGVLGGGGGEGPVRKEPDTHENWALEI